MPDVYPGGQYIPELDGAAQGGVTVVVHRPEDVEGLIALCELAARPPEEPLHAVVKVLTGGSFDLNAWHQAKTRMTPVVAQSTSDNQNEPTKRKPDDADDLIEGLTIAAEVWRKQGDEISQLALTLTIADPATVFYPNLDVGGSRAALVFRKGSLETLILKPPFKAVFYLICLCGKGGISPSVRSTNLKERLREKARSRSAGIKDLRRLHDLTPDDLMDKDNRLKKLVVFVHGLFSTDIGVFDGLIGRLEGDQKLLLAGFPHNSLAHIAVNGSELEELVHHLLWPPGNASGVPQRMALFVCHSRGGLVARSAFVQLQESDASNFVEHIAGCVTFGTPHRGASLAEYPDVFLGMATALMQLKGTASFASLIDILCVCEASGRTIFGIQDLRTPEGGGEFLLDLTKRERAASKTFRPVLDILAIGGQVPPSRRALHHTRLLGTTAHDLVVPVDSSIPRFCLSDKQLKTNCDHFHYFENDQGPILDQAVKYIYQRFGIKSLEEELEEEEIRMEEIRKHIPVFKRPAGLRTPSRPDQAGPGGEQDLPART